MERAAVWVGAVLGALLVILATLFALAVAVDRGWVGPAARVLIGLVCGTGAWLLGGRLRRKGQRVAGAALAGTGMAALYGTLWAAAGFFGVISRPVAFGFMTAVTVVAIAQATAWRDRFPAWVGLVGGLLTPFLITTADPDGLALCAYLALLTLGAVAAARQRGWWELVIGATLGSAWLFGLWTAGSLRPDEVPTALAGVGLLLLPLLLTGWRPRHGRVEVAGMVAALLLPLLALPWLLPVDPLFYDPRTGMVVVRDLGSAPWWVAGAIFLLPLPAGLLARERRVATPPAARLPRWPALLGAVFLAGLFSVLAAGAWAEHRVPPGPALLLMVAGPAVAMLLVGSLGRPAPTTAPSVALTGLAAAAVVAFAPQLDPGVASAVLAAPPLLGLLGALLTRHAAWLPATLLGSTLALLVAGAAVDELGPAVVAGPTLLAYGLLVAAPGFARRWRGQAALVVIPAALAGPAFYWPLDQAWRAALGDQVIGLLPLALGAVALLLAALVVRSLQVHRRDGGLALLVGVALLGLAAAVPVQLERQWLTLAWAFECLLLAALSMRLTHPLVRAGSIGLAVAVAVRLLLNPWALEYGDAGGDLLFNWTLYTWGVPALCLGIAARLLGRGPEPAPAWARAGVRVLAILLGFALVQVQVSVAFQDAGPIELGGHGLLQGMVRSLAWAAYGVAVLVAGLASRQRHVRLVGFALVLLATGKVFAFDLWSLEGFVRVGSVLGLGVCLLLAAFLFERLVLRGGDGPEPAPAPEVP